MTPEPATYPGYRFPAEIINHAVWLHHVFGLSRRGRPAKHPVPSTPSVEAAKLFASMPRRVFRSLSWRRGSKGPLKARFAAVRVRVADGPVAARARHLPGDEAWLVCEERAAGERKVYLADHPVGTPLRELAAAIKARWVCEQMHQQIKNELGLDYFEGRSWRGLRHQALLCLLAYDFRQRLRLGKNMQAGTAAPARTVFARGEAAPHGAPSASRPMSRMWPPTAAPPPIVRPRPPMATRHEICGCASRGHGDVKLASSPYPRRAVLGPDQAA
ncbi:hypothetical protein JMJ55_29980 [Belnapia sp. T6]|uniref:Transposase n=1 Tax=Belnapia mucosa TaxID=2804532 RepID=A0ABS1VCZ1_9PROT|nr:hypothetical protein [Belnapia mucosa]MBL6459541.1 hypothetical protein [Belnapia mucosa]